MDSELRFTSAHASDPNPILRFVHGRRLRTDLDIVRRFGGPHRRFLDYGCGDGFVVRGAAEHYEFAVGLDLDPAAIAAARLLANPENVAFALTNEADVLLRRHGPFQTVGVFQVFEHVSDDIRAQIFDKLRKASTSDAIVIVESPIESGPILVVKNVGGWAVRRATRDRYKRYRLTTGELLPRLSLRRAPHIRPPRADGSTYSHKDFSVWNLKAYIEQHCRILEMRFMPFNPLRWMNFQVIFICKWRESK